MSACGAEQLVAGLGGMSVDGSSKRPRTSSKPRVTVAIGQFDAVTHYGLAAILGMDRCIRVLARGLEQADLEDFLVRESPCVVIVDEGSEVTLERLDEIVASTSVLMLAHEPSRACRTGALAAGVVFLARSVSAADLLAAVHLAARGEGVHVLGSGEQIAAGQLDTDLLTDRERDVLDHLAVASTNAEIALVLKISVRTVEKHVASILRKLGRDRRELVGCRSHRL